MKSMARFAITPLILLVTGCATQGALDSTRSDIDAVKTRLFSVEKDLGGVREESKESLGSIKTGYKSDVAAVRKLAADIQATIDNTKNEMRLLNGKVDDIAVAVKKPTEELARYREDADKRIISMDDRITKLQAGLDELNKKITELAQQKKEEAITPDSVYMKGLETFKSGNMPAARDIFTKFLEQYPQHDLAANAHYWIGETYYSEKDYEPAILAFQEVIKNHPQKEKVPAAMLKQAMAFKAINDSKNARYVLKKMLENYPKSEEIKKAKELLKELK
ncbi:MAG: tol-pal system protein YbgF [Nitrospirae bacterium GWD2_57_9]|nr:MAG: tol-pal system protein YbgF [Nitrospirae bacterium GWD2_57_9]